MSNFLSTSVNSMNTVMLIAAITSAVCLIASVFVTWSVINNIHKIGDIPDLKSRTISRALFNFYALLVLVIVIMIRSFGWFTNEVFISLFVLILGGMGFKITAELFQKEK